MKKTVLPMAALSLILLAGCAGAQTGGTADTPPPLSSGTGNPVEEGTAEMTCRIVDGADTGTLLLAEGEDGVYQGTGIYTLSVGDAQVVVDGTETEAAALKDGMLVTVRWNGMVMESYPAQLGEVVSLTADSQEIDDRCGLYLQVLSDLWGVDPNLNRDLEELAVDFSQLTDLTESEKAALTWAFGNAHGLFPITGTWEELVEAGYIDKELLLWNGNGCLFTLSGSAEETFQAEKWASGLGAYFFNDCTAKRGADGTWTYKPTSESIA